ncbi:MAG: leucine-rich repeat protein, partial [Clostridia bacterium]|nr:leucine-rich repeat protein [Clostridia bacterium]
AFAKNLMESVSVPKSVKTLEAAFHSCKNLTNVYIDSENDSYVDISGVVYTATLDTIIQYPAGRAAHTYTVESGTSIISAFAFAGAVNLKEAVLPSGLSDIGDYAFSSSQSLISVTVPEGTLNIGISAFYASYKLETVKLPQSLLTIGDECFMLCTGLTSIELPDNIQKIGNAAFAYTDSLQSLNIPKSFTVISDGPFNSCGTRIYVLHGDITEISSKAFVNNYNLFSISIPDSVSSIGAHAFNGCWALADISISESTALTRLDMNALGDCGIRSIRIPAKISTMGQGVFSGCRYLTSVTFSEGSLLPSISAYMFDGADALKAITFENGSALSSIQAHGLEGMINLQSIDFGDALLTNIDNFAFRFCQSLESITVPEGVTYIGRYAFYGCSSLGEVALPETLEYIGRFAFLDTDDVTLYFGAEKLPSSLAEDWDYDVTAYFLGVSSVGENESYKYATLKSGDVSIIKYLGSDTAIDLTQVELGGKISVIGGGAFAYSPITSVTLPETLTTIQKEAFMGSALMSVSIPASVEFIGQNAFANTPITALLFADGALLRTIEQSAFENTSELRSLTLPASLSTLGRGAFKNSGIRELVFEDGCILATISESSFAYTKIASVTIPDSVTLIDNSAFVGISELKELNFGGGELMIMSNAFYNTGIEELTIPIGVTYIGEFAFTGLKNLTEFKVEQGHPHYKSVSGLLVSADGKKLITAPAGMTGSFTVPAEIEIIGFGAFEGSLLENVYFSDSSNILTLGHRAFYGAKNLKSIYIPDSVVSIDYYAFAECSSLEAVEFGADSKLMGIYEGAFYACKSLRSIEIPDAIVEISDFAFYGCTSLDRIPISEGSSLLGIYSYAFAYSGISGDFSPPSTLLDIGEYAFMGTKITSLTIDSNDPWNMSIGLGAFEDCNVLESLHLEFIGEFDGSDNSWLGYIFGAGDYVASPAYIPESLKKITLSENVTTLYDYAFYGVADVEKIVFGQSAITVYSRAFLSSDFDYRFTGEVTTLIKNGKSIAYAYSNHFSDRIHGDLVISDDVELIYLTRPSFTHLNSISIPGSTALISFNYLYNSLPIENVYYRGTLADWCNIEFTGDAIGLFTKNLYIDGEKIGESLTVPEGVSTLPNAFDALGIKKLSLPKSLISVDDDFYISTLEEVTVSPENKHFTSHGGLLYTKDYKALVLIPSVIGSKVELHEGLLKIPERAFMYQAALKHVVMPSTLKEIGNSAFNSCYSLVEIVLPDGVAKIGDNAFFECTSLMNVTLSASLTDIGTSAFYGDSMLCVINNRSSLALSHGSDDFGGVARNARLIVLPDGTKHYAGGSDGFEYIKTAEGLIFTGKRGSYQLNRYVGEAETVALPESINGSSYEIYYFKGAKTVVLPHGMTSIASYSFCDSETLERVILPETLQSISMWAFYNCTKLDNLVLPASLTEINTLAFDGCTSLNTVYLPDTMSEIQDYWFISSPLGNVVISDTHPTLVSFGNMVCRKDMKEIVFVSPTVKNIIIPKEIEDIGTALANSGIQSVRFEAGSRVKEITTMAFQNCGYLEYVEIPHGVTKLWHDAFQNCSALSEIILPPSVREIGESCFIGCSSLKSINIPSNMTVIPNNVFSGCSSLEEITLPERVTEIGKGAFFGCSSLKSVNIGQNVTKIGEKAFFGCSSLKGEVIGKNLTEIGNAAFAGCAYDAVSLGSGVTQFTVRDGVIYDTDFTRIIAICEQINNVTIPSTVGDIGEFFRENKYIESVVFEDGCAITEIHANAFMNCTNLKSVKLHDGVKGIGTSAFFGCTSLTDINFPNGLTRIDISAFFSSKLTSLDLPKTLLKIGENAFSHTSVKKVVFGGTTVVDSRAFDLCEIYVVVSRGNMKLTLGDRMTNGGVAANALCIVTKTGEYVYAEDVYHEGDFLFKKTNGSYLLKAYMGEDDTVTLPLTVNGEKYSIYKFHGIKNIFIPEGITEISYSAFEGGDVETVSIPSTVTSIGECAFLNCRKLV